MQKNSSGRQRKTWKEAMTQRRRVLANSSSDSFETLLGPPPPPQPSFLEPSSQTSVKKCSSCSCKKSSTTLKDRNDSSSSIQGRENKMRLQQRLQQIEAKLYNAELENADTSGKCEKAKKRLLRVEEILASLVIYIQSLDFKVRASDRLARLFAKMVCKDFNPGDTFFDALDDLNRDNSLLEKLTELRVAATSNSKSSEHLYLLEDEMREKQRNYQSATNSFSSYLRNAGKVPLNHLRGYESDFDKIKEMYECSLRAFEKELSKLLDERNNTLKQCILGLTTLIEKQFEEDKQFLNLSKELSKNFQEPTKKQSCKHADSEKYLQMKSNKH